MQVETRSLQSYSDEELLSAYLNLPPTPEEFARTSFIQDPQRPGDAWIPFNLWPAQVSLLNAFARGGGHIVLKARQLGVSWIGSNLGLWRCMYRAGQTGIIVSRDQDSAYEIIRRVKGMFVRRKDSPVRLETDNAGELSWNNGSRIIALASTQNAGSSLTGSFVIPDEFGKMPFAESTYTSIMPTINDGGDIYIIGTYTSKHGALLKKLWDGAVAGTNSLTPHFIPWHARPGRDAAWYARTAANAVSMALHRQEYPATPAEAFTDTATDEHFLRDHAMWDSLREDIPPLDKRTGIVIAADAATSSDSFGVVAVSRRAPRSKDTLVRFAREWKPGPDGVIRFGSKDDPDTPRGFIEHLIKTYRVVSFVADPYQLHGMIEDINAAGRVGAYAFGQGPRRLQADTQLRQNIINGEIAHDGTPALTEHVRNANIEIDAETRKLRIVKREQSLKIDLCVALSMANDECRAIDM